MMGTTNRQTVGGLHTYNSIQTKHAQWFSMNSTGSVFAKVRGIKSMAEDDELFTVG